jgi:glycosyltransferase involved in cell wall biosynthesis
VILGIFPPQGGSISGLRRTGQDGRFIKSYLGNYARHFAKVYYFSYADEEAELPSNCYLVKNPGYHRWIYAFLLPFVQRRYIRECDVFRVMQMYGAVPAVMAKLLYRKPYVGTYGYRYLAHARTQGMRLRAYLFEWRAYLGLKLADGVIVTTKELSSYVTKFVPRSKVVLIPNGVDTTLFRPSDARPDRSEKVVVYSGRFAPRKNLFTLIDAVALIKQPRVKLILVGEGELRNELEKHAIKRGITFEFKGIIPHEELPGILNNADVFALPSLREGHPKVLLEAMSCGLPCVGTDVEGIRDLIQDGETGLLSDLTAHDLANKIALLISDQQLASRIGRNAQDLIAERFNLDTLLKEEIRAMQAVATNERESDSGDH